MITDKGMYLLKQNEQLIDMILFDKLTAFTICEDEPNFYMNYKNALTDKNVHVVVIFPIPKMIIKLILDIASQL